MSITNMELINTSNNTIILLNKEIESLKKENENLMNTLKQNDKNKPSTGDKTTEYLIMIYKVKKFFF